LHLFNAHFSWIEDQTADNVREALPYMQSFRGPAILVGDLNAPAPANVLEPFRETGWTDAWEAHHPGQQGYTYEADSPSIRIDYAWLNPALLPALAAVEILRKEDEASQARLSNHLGLKIVLAL
jgi:endonuclease/exonuclease/phosphatase (EEP) superfamily protein YafD